MPPEQSSALTDSQYLTSSTQESSSDTEAAAHPKPKVGPIEHSTGLDIKYGERTWRPSQSVVDILQNHLDAQTSVFEKARLELVGITDYDPTSRKQSNILKEMSQLAQATEPWVQFKNYNQILRDLELPRHELSGREFNTDLKDKLLEQLRAITYRLPQLKLKLSNGQSSKYVDYDQVAQEPLEWKVVGYLVADQGAGFDHQLMGMIGASTKKADTGKRGGLGEGLKMSIAQLNRVGADVRLASQNSDQSWWLKPEPDDGGLLALEGITVDRKPTDQPQRSGSRTMVDLSQAQMSDEEWQHIRSIIDPRQSAEGIAKYILEFNRDIPIEQLESSGRLTQDDIPTGRIYVKGLLVEEDRQDLLWSYNLADKWAISGRDRKTVHTNALDTAIVEELRKIEDQDSIEALLTAVLPANSTSLPREVQCLDQVFTLNTKQRQLWQEAYINVLGFVPGKTLFCFNTTRLDEKRIAELKGFTVIELQRQAMPALSLLRTLYPGQPYLTEHVNNVDDSVVEKLEATNPSLNNALLGTIQNFKNHNLFSLSPSSGALNRLTFTQPNEQTENLVRFTKDFSFSVEQDKDTIATKREAFASQFARDTDLLIALGQVMSDDNSLSDRLQLYLEKIDIRLVARQYPQLLEIPLPLQVAHRETQNTLPIGYKPETRFEDEVGHILCDIDDLILSPNLADNTDQLYLQLSKLKEKLSQWGMEKVEEYLSNYNHQFPFVLNGQLKVITNQIEIADAEEVNPGARLVYLGQKLPDRTPEETGDTYRLYNMPLSLSPGQQQSFTFRTQDDQGQFTIRRTPYGFEFIMPNDDTYSDMSSIYGAGISYDSGTDKNRTFFSMRGNLLQFPGNIFELTLVENTDQTTPIIPEKHRGEAYISANTTLEYGSQVWNDPRRILLDTIQNHLDADHQKPPTISFQIANADGQVSTVDAEQLLQLPRSWAIIGISIEDQGNGYTTPYLTQLGSTTKSDEDTGKFGEGLKMLAASAVRQHIHLELSSRQWTAHPTSTVKTITNHDTGQPEQFEMLGYQMDWHDQPRQGSKTSFSLFENLGPTLTPEQQQQVARLTQPFRLGKPDARYVQQMQTWRPWIDMLDPRITDFEGRSGLDRYILPESAEQFKNRDLGIIPDRPGEIYEKNLLVPNGQDGLSSYNRLMFGYNLRQPTINTRERNNIDAAAFNRLVSNFFDLSTDLTLAKYVLEQAKRNPGINFYEYEIMRYPNSRNSWVWRQAYYEVFGQDAILSVKNIYGSASQLEARGDMKVALERHNMVVLPDKLTRFLMYDVYTSRDYGFDRRGEEVSIDPTERQQIENYITQVNQMVISHFEQMLQNPDQLEYLSRAWSDKADDADTPVQLIRKRLNELKNMTGQDIRVGSKYNSRGGAYSGIHENRAQIELNQSLFADRNQLLGTYLHEVFHHLSGKSDFELDFQRYFAALALHIFQKLDQKSSPSAWQYLQSAKRMIRH